MNYTSQWLVCACCVMVVLCLVGCSGGGDMDPRPVAVRATLQAAPQDRMACTVALQFFRRGSDDVISTSVSLDNNGTGETRIPLSEGLYDVRAKAPGYLSRRIVGWTYAQSGSLPLIFSQFLAGDCNGNNVVDQPDFDYLQSVWDTADLLADFNRDGTVNIFDFSILNSNWEATGE